MKTIKVDLYNYNELSDEAKDRAMNEHIDFIIEMLESIPHWGEEFKEDIKEAERNQTPWFLGQIIYQNNKDKLIKELEGLDDCFYDDGTRFNKRN